MKPTVVRSEESLGRVEELLRESAAWEPERPAPEGLVTRALAAEMARNEEQRRRRPRARRMAFWGLAFGGMAGAGACASLALGLIQRPGPAVAVQPTPHPTAASTEQPLVSSHEVETATVSVPRQRPRHAVELAASVTRRPAYRRRQAERNAAPLARWQEAPLPDEPSPVLAPGWLVENTADGSLVATPGVIAIPVNACAPPDSGEETGEGSAAAAPLDNPNEPLEMTDHDKDTH